MRAAALAAGPLPPPDGTEGRVAQWLARCGDAPVRFAPASAQPVGVGYEPFIHGSSCVPTRDNLHDLFNGLAWLHYPRTKRLLNHWQAQSIAAQGVGAVRGPLRDAITLLDENGALFDAPAPLWDALIARQWQRLFVELCARCGSRHACSSWAMRCWSSSAPYRAKTSPPMCCAPRSPCLLVSIQPVWTPGWPRRCTQTTSPPSPLFHFLSWGFRAGARATRRFASMMTRSCSVPPVGPRELEAWAAAPTWRLIGFAKRIPFWRTT